MQIDGIDFPVKSLQFRQASDLNEEESQLLMEDTPVSKEP